MERTCKDCKHQLDCYASRIGTNKKWEECRDFTPKEPVKISLKPAGEHCKGCVYDSNRVFCGNSCVFGPFSKKQHVFEQPKPGEKKRTIKEYCLELEAKREEELKKKQQDHESHIGLLNSRLQNQKNMYQRAISDLEEYINRILNKPPKKAKEKPMLAKFTSRRYVMLCTLYVTTKIAIVLNPWLFRLAGLVRPEWGSIRGKLIREGNGNYIREMIPVPWDSGSWKQIAAVWACAILVCTAICGAIYAFNEATAWIFGEKK